MKKVAPIISYLFHPLIMPSLGLLLLLNSGTYLSLLDPAAKRAIIFVMALGTLVFPLMMLPILYYRNLVSSYKDATREERLVPQVIILVLYIITFIYFNRLPLSRVIHAYVLSVAVVLLLVILLNLRYKICVQSAALGGLTGLIIALIFLYETPLQGVLMLSILAGGLSGSSRLAMGINRWWEVLTGYMLGFCVVLVTILIY
ncbi:MAG: hypothetical protein KAR16_05315 [Bacteroidales bacterium]|nr:hypothetical protein [Bacteroidales bacterium]